MYTVFKYTDLYVCFVQVNFFFDPFKDMFCAGFQYM